MAGSRAAATSRDSTKPPANTAISPHGAEGEGVEPSHDVAAVSGFRDRGVSTMRFPGVSRTARTATGPASAGPVTLDDPNVTPGDQRRDAGMTVYTYPHPVLLPQLEHV